MARDLIQFKPVVLDQFGERECVLSGIIRESIAFGCAVFCDNIFYPGFAKNLDHGVPTVQAFEVGGLLRAFQNYVRDEDYRQELFERCQNYSLRNFNSERFISHFLELQ